MAGLLLAAAFTGGDFAPALWVCVAFLLLAMALGGIGLPGTAHAAVGASLHPHLHLDVRALARFPKLILPSGVDLHFYHLNLNGLRRLPQTLGTAFGRFLLSWFVFAFAVAAFFSYFPLMLAKGYGIAAHASAMIYAVTAALGIGLYVLTSRLTGRYGPARVYRAGLMLRLLGFGLLLVPLLIPMSAGSPLGVVGFALIVIAWPLISVSGTDLGASLTPFSEGAAVGLLNAALALATALGIVVSGPLVARWGYATIAAMAIAGLVISLWLGMDAPHGRSAPRADGPG